MGELMTRTRGVLLAQHLLLGFGIGVVVAAAVLVTGLIIISVLFKLI